MKIHPKDKKDAVKKRTASRYIDNRAWFVSHRERSSYGTDSLCIGNDNSCGEYLCYYKQYKVPHLNTYAAVWLLLQSRPEKRDGYAYYDVQLYVIDFF